VARKELEAADFLNTGIAGVVDFMSMGAGIGVQVVTEREFKSTPEGNVEYEAFMRQPIVIRISRTGDKNEPAYAFVGDNGVSVWIPREKPVRLPRCFVETLARSQERHYRQERNPDPNADEGMTTRRSGSASYPFAVLHDPDPRGRAWLQRVTHESA
jgi:hypothetical protein